MPLTRIQNTAGSWLEKIGRVTGVPKLSVTDLRKGAEKIIQDDEEMKKNVKSLNFHSQEVGRAVYNQGHNIQIRGEYVNKLEIMESQKEECTPKELSEFEQRRQERIKETRRKDDENRIASANVFLQDQKEKRNLNVVYSKRVKVLPNDRKSLQELISEELFPEDKNFPQGKTYILYPVFYSSF